MNGFFTAEGAEDAENSFMIDVELERPNSIP